MSRFQFVADHQHAFEVKRLCELVEVSRSSFYVWLAAAPQGHSVPSGTRCWPSRSGPSKTLPKAGPCYGAHGSPPSSTTANPQVSGSTTSGGQCHEGARSDAVSGRQSRNCRTRRRPTCWSATSNVPGPIGRLCGRARAPRSHIGTRETVPMSVALQSMGSSVHPAALRAARPVPA